MLYCPQLCVKCVLCMYFELSYTICPQVLEGNRIFQEQTLIKRQDFIKEPQTLDSRVCVCV